MDFPWKKNTDTEESSSPQREKEYQAAVASEAFETGEDYLIFPKSVLLPVTTRGSGVPGMERHHH